MTGKLIAIAGINRLGKTTQAKRLVAWLETKGISVQIRKYPVYELQPTGPIINGYLRHDNPYQLTPWQAQAFYAQNRHDFEPQVLTWLEDDIWVVCEDHVITGLAWGLAGGISRAELDRMQLGLRLPDITFMFEGEPFLGATEVGHLHEQDDELTCRAAEAHLALSAEFGCYPVHANQTEDAVFAQIENVMQRHLR